MISNQKIRASHKTRCYRTMTWNQIYNNREMSTRFIRFTKHNFQCTQFENWIQPELILCVCNCALASFQDCNFPNFTYNDLRLCKPKNILLWISVILFSDMSKSCIFNAPSNAFGSMPVIWLRRKSNFTKFGKRPNSPSDLMRPNSLSLSNLKWSE